jgi:alpha-tubulin suppressor-like RCC1 family protein
MSQRASSGEKPVEGRSVRSVLPRRGRPAIHPVILLSISLAIAAALPAVGALAAPPGTPLAWGANTYGQLGDGTTVAHRTPATVSGITGAIDIAAGREHALALMGDGTVRTWGRNNFGQIGDGSTTNRPTPVTVPGLAGVTDIAGGHNHSMALLADGTVRDWGYNASGQIGDGTTTNRRSPVPVSGLTGVTAIAGGLAAVMLMYPESFAAAFELGVA